MAREMLLEGLYLLNKPVFSIVVVMDMYLGLSEPPDAMCAQNIEYMWVILLLWKEIGMLWNSSHRIRVSAAEFFVSFYPVLDPFDLQVDRVILSLNRFKMIDEGEQYGDRP